MSTVPVSERPDGRRGVPMVVLFVGGLLGVVAIGILFAVLARRGPRPDAAGDEPGWEFELSVDTDAIAGGFMGPEADRDRERVVVAAQDVVDKRLREMGVPKWSVTRQPSGAVGQLLVQVSPRQDADVDRIKARILTEGFLELKLVEGGPAPSTEALLRGSGGAVREGTEVLRAVATDDGGTGSAFYLVRDVSVVTGFEIRNARPTLDEFGKPAVAFSLNTAGAARLRAATQANVGRRLAIVMDRLVQSAPRIEGPIGEEGRITGSFTNVEAQDLASILRAGALPARVRIVSERRIGGAAGR